MNDIIPFQDIKQMADALGKTGMFGKTPEQMLALMLIAQAEGLHPAQAAMQYDVIQGKPAINSKSALARFQAGGGKIAWVTRTDTEASATFTHPAGGSLTVKWDMARAAQAGISGKDNWKKWPAQMLSARVIAEGVRAVYPACLSGLYSVEEVQDMEPRNVTPEPARIEPPKAEPPAPDSDEYRALLLLIESADGQVDGGKLDILREAASKHKTDAGWCSKAAMKLSDEMDRQTAIMAANVKPDPTPPAIKAKDTAEQKEIF